MSEQENELLPKQETAAERVFEEWMFRGRWLLAPFYVGLLLALMMLMVKFVQALWHAFSGLLAAKEADFVISILSLVDIALVANLLVMVSFVRYDHFVSRLGSDTKWS